MSLNKFLRNKGSGLLTEQETQTKSKKLKRFFFEIVANHLQQNLTTTPLVYYAIVLVQQLSFLWYLLHPNLNIYGDVTFLKQARLVLRAINFHQYLSDDSELYTSFFISVAGFKLISSLLLLVSSAAIIYRWEASVFKYLKKIVNVLFLLSAKGLSGPIIGFCINILYCDDNSYHKDQQCYDPLYIGVAITTLIILCLVLFDILIYSTVYCVKSLLCGNYVAQKNKFYMLSKSIIKIVLPLYFALPNYNDLIIIFLYGTTAIWGAYLFWHRFNSIHSYNPFHFYFQYFLEIIIFWATISNLIYYYISYPMEDSISFIYSVFIGGLLGYMLVILQTVLQEHFLKDYNQVKGKRDIQRLTVILASKLIHSNNKKQDVRFLVKYFSKSFLKRPPVKEEKFHEYSSMKMTMKETENTSQETYAFFQEFLNENLKQSKSLLLKKLQIEILGNLGKKSKAMHKYLELKKKTKSFFDEFGLFRYQNLQKVAKQLHQSEVNKSFIKQYKYNMQKQKLQALMEICVRNNYEFWQELTEIEPSLAKLKNLASRSHELQTRIGQIYAKLDDLVPQNYVITHLYFGFLLKIGANAKTTYKVGEKLRSILQVGFNSVGRLQQEILSKNTSMLSIGCVGNELGIITNSNSEIQNLLGFDRESLIGKNVTRLMPEIYSELHNNFLLKYINRQDAHYTMTNKLVPALSRNNLLVQTKLRVKLMLSYTEGIWFVGGLKKFFGAQNQNQEYGLMMYNMLNSKVLAINESFQRLVNGKITPKQIIHEQIKLSMLLPSLNFDLILQNNPITTTIQVGLSKQMLEIQKIKAFYLKEVEVQLQHIKFYQGIKIGFLKVSQKVPQQKKFVYIKQNFFQQRRKSRQLNSINEIRNLDHDPQNSLTVQNMNELLKKSSQQLAILWKCEQYIKKRELSNYTSKIKVIIFVFVIIFLISPLLAYLQHSKDLRLMISSYKLMNQTINMLEYQAQISLFIEKIWSISNNDFNLNDDQYFSQLSESISLLSTSYSKVITAQSSINSDLLFNRENYATYYQYTVKNQVYTSGSVQIPISYYIPLFISSASKFIDFRISNGSKTNLLDVEALFIRANGEYLVPYYTQLSLSYFERYLINHNNYQIPSNFVNITVIVVLLIVLFILSGLFGNYLRKSSNQVIATIEKLKFIDVQEMISHFKRFLSQKRKPNTRKCQDQGSNVSSEQTFFKVPKQLTEKQMQDEIIYKSSKFLAQKEKQHQQPPKVQSELQGERLLLEKKNKDQTVNLNWTYSNKPVIFGITCTIGILAILLLLFYFQMLRYKDTINSAVSQQASLGEMRKTVKYLDYFSYRLITNSTDEQARTLINSNIQTFFNNSAKNYEVLTTPMKILKNVYSQVQTLQQWLAVPGIAKSDVLQADYSRISQSMSQGEGLLIQLDYQTLFPLFSATIQEFRQLYLFFALIVMFLICVTSVGLYLYFIRPIIKQNIRSVSMLRMIPSWLVKKNEILLKQLSQQTNGSLV